MSCQRLSRHSEAYSASGNLAADGCRKLLGAPSIDLVQTVVRESVQNSCDAALSDGGAEVHFRLRSLARSELETLRDTVLVDRPDDEKAGSLLEDFLSNRSAHVLEICDFGTKGLAGPTRADIAAAEGEPTHFVDFVRNIGSHRGARNGGGTYGYGKTSLYLASRCSTIVIDSQTISAGHSVRRVIAAQLGSAFSSADSAGLRRHFTGRHWWGRRIPGNDDYVDPVEGEEAVSLADALGFPERSREDSGTSIMILDPVFLENDCVHVLDAIKETLLWFFWPRLLKETREDRKMHFRLFLNDQEQLMPKPEDFPPLNLFAEAMQKLNSSSGEDTAVQSFRPKRVLGHMAVVKDYRSERVGSARREGSLFPEYSAAIAVMRPVELVVRYFTGPPMPNNCFEWAGVFVSSDDDVVEGAFVKAEPPAHDDWQYEALTDKQDRSIVKIAVERIRSTAQEVANPSSPSLPGGEKEKSLANIAGIFGRMLASNGEGAWAPRSATGNGRNGQTIPSVSQPEFIRLEQGEKGAVGVFEFVIRGNGSALSLHLAPHLVMDGSTTSKSGSVESPVVTHVFDEQGTEFEVGSDGLVAIGEQRGRFEVSVTIPADCAVALNVCTRPDESAS